MFAGAALAVLIAAGAGGQGPDGPDVGGSGPRVETWRVGVGAVAPDTIKPRRKAVRLSEAYEFRVKVHRWASYATVPLFVAEYAAGDQLLKKGRDASGWAGNFHGFGAGAIATLFGVNTLTGGLNWWETRHQTEGRAWRTTHSALMLLADAGFVVTGALAGDSEGGFSTGGDQRKRHRDAAVASMSVATVSYLMMLKPFRKD